MATRGETGWQLEKTLAECMRYMLGNEIATDVCFEVGPSDGTVVKIRAHKYVLIARSPVFEAMFASGMTECRIEPVATIRVEDIDAAVFKKVLTYIYCERVSLCPKSAASVMYAAHKYMLPKLVRECGKFLLEGLNVNNVIHILEQSVLFDDKKLKSECLKLISMNSNAIFTGAKIMSPSRQAMETILGMDFILLDESIIYETSISWAKHQLRGAILTDNPTDLQIRKTLGNLLYKIRFPIMHPNIFAEISSEKDVLTAEEKESIYYFLVTKKKSPKLMFPTEQRINEVWIDRTVNCVTAQWHSAPNVDAINFAINHDILLTGVGLYTGYNGRGYDVDLEILKTTEILKTSNLFFMNRIGISYPGNSLFKKRITVPYTGDSTPFKILLDEPIFIRAGVVHSVKALSNDSIGHYGHQCQAVCTKEKVTFTFSRHKESESTNDTYGQIPRFYFAYL